jgi:hypothetical protein
MRLILPLAVCLAAVGLCQSGGGGSAGDDPREIVRRSVELDQANWLRMADYTWVGRLHERHFDAHDRVTAEHSEAWESFVLDGQPFHRMLEREGKPLPDGERQKQEEKLDKAAAKLESETSQEKQRRADDYQKSRRRERAFLREIPDAFNFRLEGTVKIDGQDVWVVSGTPKADYHPKTRDGAALLKIHGKMWIEKSGYQWVRVEAQTTAVISFGWFLARLNPGAKLVLEQQRVNDEVWLPKREYMIGSGRVALVKRLAEDEEITWSNYKKFRVESKITSGGE